jgi:hypothetical protein
MRGEGRGGSGSRREWREWGIEVGYEVKGAEVSVGGVTVGLKGKGSYKGRCLRGR